MNVSTPDVADTARAVGLAAARLATTVAVAESLTGGQVCAELARVPGSSEWFSGGVVAYRPEVKYGLLSVPEGPVVSRPAALAMAAAVARTHGAAYGVALTGVGGPGPEDGIPAGTVVIAVHGPGREAAEELHLDDDDPAVVCRAAIGYALQMLHIALTADLPKAQAG